MSARTLAGTLLALLLIALTPARAQEDGGLDAGREALARGDYDAALASARTLTADAGAAPGAWRLLGAALAATGAYDAAIDAYDRVSAGATLDLPAAVAAARLVALRQGAPAAAARIAHVLDSGRARAAPRPVADEIALGDAYRLEARDNPTLFRFALERYEAAVQADPQSIAAHVAMGELLLDRFNNTEALEAFRAALALDATAIPALLGLARSQRFDHSPTAEETLRWIIGQQPNTVAAREQLARLLIDSEHYADAEEQLAQALAVNPNDPAARAARAALHYLRDEGAVFDAAVNAIRELTPGYTRLFETLSEIAGQNRRYVDALEFARVATELAPNAWRAHALLGENRLRLGDMAGGRESLETAFRGDPFDVRTRNTLHLLDRLDGYATVASDRFVLVAAPDEIEVLAPRLLALAEDAFDFYSTRYVHKPPTPIRIEFYPQHEDFSVRTVGLVGVDIVGVSFGPVIALDSPSSENIGPLNWGSTVWHEIAHSFHLDLTNSRVPRWFTEGLSVYEERVARQGWGQDVSPSFLRAYYDGRLAPASDLNQSFLRPSYPEQIPHAYYQASLLMEMIERDHGFDAILGMLRGYAEGRSTAALLEHVLGTTAEAFDAAFNDYVATRFRASLDGLFGVPGAADEARATYPELLEDAAQANADGNHAAARDLLWRALEQFPDHAGPGSAYRLLATLEQGLGNAAAAAALLEASIAIDADDLVGHRELAALYGAAGHGERAIAVLEKALLIQPFLADVHAELATLYEADAAWEPAVAARHAVVALDPPDPVGARYELARALHAAGLQGEAKREVLATLEQAPLYEDALELLLDVRDALRPGAEPDPVNEPAR